MPICPHCKKDINYLRFEQEATKKGSVEIDQFDDLVFMESDSEEEFDEPTYFCPLCKEKLEFEGDQIIKFLRGRK